MKPQLLLYDLLQFLKTQHIILNTNQIQQLELYYSELKTFSERLNLMSSNDKIHIIERHFVPSFYYLYYLHKESKLTNKCILDLGTGAGLPGIILAIALSDSKLTLIDSSRKKILFLRNLVTKLDLKVEVICERIESLSNNSVTNFDIIVARAVASIPVLYNWSVPFLKTNGYLMTLKGENYMEEVVDEMNNNLTAFLPEESWCRFTNYLNNKRMIKLIKIKA